MRGGHPPLLPSLMVNRELSCEQLRKQDWPHADMKERISVSPDTCLFPYREDHQISLRERSGFSELTVIF